MLRSDTKELLRRYACKYERTFPSPDPSEVMLAAKGDANREATAFVASCLSFGSIKQFMPKIESLVAFAKGDMDDWIRSGAFAREIPDDEKRTFYRFILREPPSVPVYVPAGHAILRNAGRVR